MARLKENQEAMDRGEWDSMPARQRRDVENTFRHTGQLARYTNIMGIKTVNRLLNKKNSKWPLAGHALNVSVRNQRPFLNSSMNIFLDNKKMFVF